MRPCWSRWRDAIRTTGSTSIPTGPSDLGYVAWWRHERLGRRGLQHTARGRCRQPDVLARNARGPIGPAPEHVGVVRFTDMGWRGRWYRTRAVAARALAVGLS